MESEVIGYLPLGALRVVEALLIQGMRLVSGGTSAL
jgi:hypothetical protein